MTIEAVPAAISIEALRKGYRHGGFTPEDVIMAIVERVDRERDSNIWILPPTLDRIKPYLERLSDLNPVESPLWGIPFAVKDNIEVAGWPVTAACPDFTYVPEQHAAVVERLIAAGAIPVGKANLDQFATGLVGTRSPYGATHNALSPELISGGSSSGSAVAVACGQAAFALGTDTAGSGRVPAALNGLVGYKPTVGAWPSQGVIPACRSLDCVTVFARSVEDAELVDGVVRGYLASDPYSKDRPLGRPMLPVTWLFPSEPPQFFGPFASEYEAAWNRAKETLIRSGVKVKEVDVSLLHEAAALLYEGPLVAERWSHLADFIESHPGSATPVTETILRSGAKAEFTAATLFQAQHRLADIRRHTEEMLKGGVLVLPTCGGTWTREQVNTDPIATNSQMGLYTNHCNLLDLSAIAIPAGFAKDRLPFGITLFTLPEEEANMVAASRFFLKQTELITVAVCGLHMRGMVLEPQMTGLGAIFVEEAVTAPKYQLFQLPTAPPKPGLVRVREGGSSMALELWEMSADAFGIFTASIPAPLGIGKIELVDGRLVSGFVCESYAVEDALDLTSAGGWRNAMENV
ncbi:allophanate hydrolase [Paenibacillus sp. p3-SID867]|uniref:allophanate hydrolase n=1 Tax=Paenibacillus sp. p3-SID867 TaxID=2916363 RepID=UPI0021A55D9B|nr:allophanate hydrolase [Paenibacillus sp. p3-SID867]MCT1400252.1 allophanate hydrolase [Paenibacillus sp. p3-SID867]